jgi:hypothetical protein
MEVLSRLFTHHLVTLGGITQRKPHTPVMADILPGVALCLHVDYPPTNMYVELMRNEVWVEDSVLKEGVGRRFDYVDGKQRFFRKIVISQGVIEESAICYYIASTVLVLVREFE